MAVVYVCPDELEGILTGVYEALREPARRTPVKLELAGYETMELFCEYRYVKADAEKSDALIREIRGRICQEAWETVYKAALCPEGSRADRIYRFAALGFKLGRRVMTRLQEPEVFALFEMSRRVGNEAHHFLEFLHFSQLKEGILAGKISPKADVAALLAPHFADRLPGENWMIYDTVRKKAVVHPANRQWRVVLLDSGLWEERLKGEDEGGYEALWKIFHKSVSIQERENPRCQRNMLPLRFRPNMTEFQS